MTSSILVRKQRDIIDVLLWIRRYKYIFMTDIVKMFRQIEVHPDDWDLQRILWVNEQLEVQAYRLKTITYGTRSAPYLACRTLIQLVEDERENYPLAADPILRGSYVDDISGGADTVEHLNDIARQLNDMCTSACLPLDIWKSNSPEFIIPSTSQLKDESMVHTFDESLSKVLGISWLPSQDQFTFQGTISEKNAVTKRSILSEVSQFFDPLGLIAPVVIRAKILLQQLWLEKLGWDEQLSPDTIHQWIKFREDISKLTQLQIPRWIQLQSDLYSVQLHGFSDASQLIMAAVVYLRVTDQEENSTITLVCSKTKVAPIKRLTIPRLELSVAVLLSQLVRHVQITLELPDIPVFLWTDSSITLAWVKSNPMKWKEYVGNRVAAIHQALPNANWKYTTGKLNPADCASRGLDAHQLTQHKLYPSDLIDLPCVKIFHKDLRKLLRLTALCQRAVSCFRRVPNSSLSISPISPADLEKARLFWIKTTQNAYFSSEISTIQSGKQLPKSHALSRLTARLDHQGILRVGGGLQNSQLNEESKDPPILPRQCKLSELLIADAHSRTLHGGTQLTLTYLRRQCCILGGRAPIKSFIQRCLVCARIRAVRTQQLMAPLPASRVTPSLVFETTGVDYAGPITLKTF
ncbi:GSCOCG00011937001-RA-CDS [Cotesia congregata]|nr:GSCOCG00011937001-RA-CDS [Cotesia congregata]